MDRRIQTLLAISLVFTIGLVFLTTNPRVVHGDTEPWFSDQLDPLRFLKRFADVQVVGKGNKPAKVKIPKKINLKKPKPIKIKPQNPIPPVGPNILFAIDTSIRMQFDADGNYYDLGT